MKLSEGSTRCGKEKGVRWKERDKKMLFERVRDRYLEIRKLRFNILRIDPMKFVKKRAAKEHRKKKVRSSRAKKARNVGGFRKGLRSSMGKEEGSGTVLSKTMSM